MGTRVFATGAANAPAMRMAMGFCEVHVNTIKGFWSLLRSWLRPHRGISQEKLPDHLASQFVHNARRRARALLAALIADLVA